MQKKHLQPALQTSVVLQYPTSNEGYVITKKGLKSCSLLDYMPTALQRQEKLFKNGKSVYNFKEDNRLKLISF